MGNKWICVSRKTGTRFMKHKIRGRNLKSGTPNQGEVLSFRLTSGDYGIRRPGPELR